MLTRRQWATLRYDARSQLKKSMMEALVLAVTQAVSTSLQVVRMSQLLLPEEETRGLSDLEELLMSGERHLRLRQSEEEVKAIGRYCSVLHP